MVDRDGRRAVEHQGEFIRRVQDLRVIKLRAVAGGEEQVDVEAARGVLLDLELGDVGAGVVRVIRELDGRGGRGFQADRRQVRGEDHFLAKVVLEAHLEAAGNGEQADLVGDVCEEEHGHAAGGNARQVGVEAAADAERTVGEVQFSDDQDLAVGADLDDHLAVENRVGSIDGVDLGAAGDGHRRGEGGEESTQRRVVFDGAVLGRDLVLHLVKPKVRVRHGQTVQRRIAQLFRLIERWQGLEELHTRGEVRHRQTGDGLQQDRDPGSDLYAERTQLGQGEPDGQDADPRQVEAALNTNEEHAVLNSRQSIQGGNDVAGGVELDDPADQGARKFAPEQVPGDRHPDGGDVHDREFAIEQLADVNLHALDRAGEGDTLQPVEPGYAGGDDDLKVGRVLIDVAVPDDAQLVDLDRHPGGPHEGVARGPARAQEHAEAGQALELAVAQNGEVARFPADDQAADGQFGADAAKADDFLGADRVGVDEDVLRLDHQEAADGDADGVGVELEAVHMAVGEGQGEADGLGVGGGFARIDGFAVGDGGGECATQHQLRAAGGDEDLAVEGRDPRLEVHFEVRDADADVIQLEHRADADLAVGGGRGRGRRAGSRGPADDERGLAKSEAVLADDQAGNDHVVRGAGAVRDREGLDHSAHIQLGEFHRGGADAHQFLVVRAGRVVRDADVGGGGDHRVGHGDLQAADAQAEGAGDEEVRGAEGQRIGHVDAVADGQRSQHVVQHSRHAVAGLRGPLRGGAGRSAEVEAGGIDTQAKLDHDRAVLELEAHDGERRADQDHGAERDFVGGHGRVGGGIGQREGLTRHDAVRHRESTVHRQAGGRTGDHTAGAEAVGQELNFDAPLGPVNGRERSRYGAGGRHGGGGHLGHEEVAPGVASEGETERGAIQHRGEGHGVEQEVHRSGAGELELGGGVLDRGGVDGRAVRGVESHVNIRTRIHRPRIDQHAVERAVKRSRGRGRRQRGGAGAARPGS